MTRNGSREGRRPFAGVLGAAPPTGVLGQRPRRTVSGGLRGGAASAIIGGKGSEHVENQEIERCGYLCVHEELVDQVRAHMPDDDTLVRLADLFKVFGDGTRIRILYALFEAEVCVCDLAKLLGMTQSAVSHQLRTLKQARLIKSRRDGKTVFYTLADDHVSTLLRQGTEHIRED